MGLLSFAALLLFASFTEAQSNGGDLVDPSLAEQPTLFWINAQTLQILFPADKRDNCQSGCSRAINVEHGKIT